MNIHPDVGLDTEVRNLLVACRGDWPAVVIACEVSHSWISKFVRGHIDNPGFNTLKRIQAHLTAGPAATREVT